MRALLVSLLLSLALAGVAGGRAPVPVAQASDGFGPAGRSQQQAVLPDGAERGSVLLSSGQKSRRGPGHHPLPAVLLPPIALHVTPCVPALPLPEVRTPRPAVRVLPRVPRAPPV